MPNFFLYQSTQAVPLNEVELSYFVHI